MTADDRISFEKQHTVLKIHIEELLNVEELRTRRTAGCPLVLKGVSLGGEEGFHTSMMWQSEPTPFPRPKRREWCSFCYGG